MRTLGELREHFEIERELADRLRSAPTKEARRALYGEVYRLRSERIPHHPLVRQAHDATGRASAVAPQVRLLRPFVHPGVRFCEVGAGDGAVARALAPLVAQAIALDVTDALAVPDDAGVGFEFRVFDGFDLGVSDGSLDLVYSNDVVEHLHPDDMPDHARAVRRALVPGGRYVCVTPNRLSGPHDISRHFADAALGFHLREYTVTELAETLRRAGFTDVRIVLTVAGRRLSPLASARLLAPIESALSRLPPRARRGLARGLTAAKVVAVA